MLFNLSIVPSRAARLTSCYRRYSILPLDHLAKTKGVRFIVPDR